MTRFFATGLAVAIATAATFSTDARDLQSLSFVNTFLNGFAIEIPGPIEVSKPGDRPFIAIPSGVECTNIVIGALSLENSSGGSKTTSKIIARDIDAKCNVPSVVVSKIFLIGTVRTGVTATVSGIKAEASVQVDGTDFSQSAPTKLTAGDCKVS
jgi:hypothetical protein